MKGQPKSTRKNSILYSLWKVLQFLFLFAPVVVVFLCSFVNLLPEKTINKMLFTLNFILLHGIHLPTVFKSTEITVQATKASVPQAGFFKKRIWCLCLRRDKWPAISKPHWLQKRVQEIQLLWRSFCLCLVRHWVWKKQWWWWWWWWLCLNGI